MTAQPMISVMIVNYNSGPYLADCLRSLAGGFGAAPLQLLVADNASSDESVALAREAVPEARIIEMGGNLGFGKAMNRLAAMATAPWLFLLNPDAVLEGEAWFDALQAFVLAHPRMGVMGPSITNSDGSFQAACIRGEPSPWNSFCDISGLAKRFPGSRLFAGYHLGHLDRSRPQQVHAVSGSAFFIRRQLFMDINGFDERFFLFAEDLDLCRRAGEAGFEVWYNPGVSLTHHKGKCSTARPAFVKHHFYLSMALYFDKYYNHGLGRLLRPVVWMATRRLGPKAD